MTVVAEPDSHQDTGGREPRADMPRSSARPWPAIAGLLAAAFGLSVGELWAGLFGGAGPVVIVGDRVIDGVPRSVKTFAIDTFGRNDKLALIIGILVLVGLYSMWVGTRAYRRFSEGIVGIAGFAIVGITAAITGRTPKASDVLPVLAAGVGALVALWVLLSWRGPKRDRRATRLITRNDAVATGGFDRRRFLVAGAGLAGTAVVAGAVGRKLQGGSKATAKRKTVRLPRPKQALPAVDPAALVDAPNMTPFVTPNASYYRIDTALVVPRVDVSNWALTINGMVDKPIRLTYDDLLGRPLVEHDCTLMCVSNEIGGDLIGNARWLGVRLADVLKEAGVKPEADQVFSTSVDGFTAGFPVSVALDGREALIAVGMNGEPLPFRHGYPARLVIPGIYGYVSAVKWLSEIRLTRFDQDNGYWIPRGWAQLAPIKTGSRIDVPGRGDLPAGRAAIAGVAWAQHRGVAKVEVQVDDQPWQMAELAADGGIDTWRQWKLAWDATPGRHRVRVRATDATGELQPEQRTDVAPDGATGWHEIGVRVV